MKTTNIVVAALVAVVVVLVAWVLLVNLGQRLVRVEDVGLAGGHTSGFIEEINGEERSITVNGKEYFVPRDAEIKENGIEVGFEALKAGDMVEITWDESGMVGIEVSA